MEEKVAGKRGRGRPKTSWTDNIRSLPRLSYNEAVVVAHERDGKSHHATLGKQKTEKQEEDRREITDTSVRNTVDIYLLPTHFALKPLHPPVSKHSLIGEPINRWFRLHLNCSLVPGTM